MMIHVHIIRTWFCTLISYVLLTVSNREKAEVMKWKARHMQVRLSGVHAALGNDTYLPHWQNEASMQQMRSALQMRNQFSSQERGTNHEKARKEGKRTEGQWIHFGVSSLTSSVDAGVYYTIVP